ncbi:MAG: hypothetical protein P8101_22160 [Candidatus Thiodiazotropha sp.]|jgi:toxin ParE1/3/4
MTNNVEILLAALRFGKKVTEIGEDNVREIIMFSYRSMYELMQDTICIHDIYHKRQHVKPENL